MSRESKKQHEAIHLSVVACGDRLEETIVMIKSALMFSTTMLHVHIFADNDLQEKFRTELAKIPEDMNKRFQLHIYNIQYPSGYNANEWRQVFKTCATQRLFIPDILHDVDRLLYVDTDILFLRPPEDIWDFFRAFNSSQLAALAWEHEDGSAGWYNRFARHPYYPPYGLNSGVMLMDLPALRRNHWTKLMKEYYDEYKLRITWGDQDLINIFFHYYPEKLYVFSCEYNYRPDHCMYVQNCRKAAENGVSVLHGCRGVYHNEKQVLFRAMYRAFKEYKLGDDLEKSFLDKLLQYVADPENSKDRCYKERSLFTKRLIVSVKDVLQRKSDS